MKKAKIFVPWFTEAVNFLWENKNNLPQYFQYPDYGGMPEKLHKVISGDFVDVIQDIYDSSSSNRFKKYSTQKAFVTAILVHDAWNPIEVITLSSLLDNLIKE